MVEIKAKNRIIPFYEIIEKANKIHSNKYDYSSAIYINTTTKIEIKCNKCSNIFSQTPNSHLEGKGCKNCAWNNLSNQRKKSFDLLMKQFKELYKNKYDYSNFQKQ